MFGIEDFSAFLIPIGIGLYLLWLLWTRPGEPTRDSATIEYEPPENLTPGECGALLENVVDVRFITATIVDLSVKGYLTIDHNSAGRTPGGQNDDGDYYFHLTKPLSEWKNLKRHEWQVASAIFIPTNPLQMLSEAMSDMQKGAGGSNPLLAAKIAEFQALAASPALHELSEAANTPQPSAGLSELRNHFPLHLGRIRKAVFDALQSGGYYTRRPDQIRLVYTAAAVVTGLLIALIGLYLGKAGMPVLPWMLSALITAFMIWIVGLIMPARSVAGVRALGKVRGFKDFLARVEKGRLEKLDDSPQLFEKYLPYAMALGVDSGWAEAFASIAVPPPQWYRGKNNSFFPAQFVSGLNSASEQMGNVKTRAPSDGKSGKYP
jgi:predicted membrane protein DUF2207